MGKKRAIIRGSAHHQSLLAATEKLAEAADSRADDTDELIDARLLARKGDCEPLIRLLWPSMIVEGKDAERLGRGVRIDNFQIDLINSIMTKGVGEVFVKGCTGAGKGCSIAMAAVIWYYVHDDGCVVLTSTSYDHAIKVIWAEVRRWIKAAALDMPGNLLKEMMDGSEKRYIKVANPETEEGFSGHHSSAVLFIFDEATAIPDARYDMAITQAHTIVAAANPRTLSGWFRRCFPKQSPDITQTVDGELGLRRLITVDGAVCANVVHEDDDLIPGQIELVRYKALKSNPDPRFAAVFAHGKFPEEDPERQVILASYIEVANAVWKAGIAVQCFGLDVAASEGRGDSTFLAAGGLGGCSALHGSQKRSTMATVGWSISVAREVYGIDLTIGQNPICVDTDGLGKGVGDRLAELGCWVVYHTGNATSEVDPRRYGNMRAESCGELGRRLDPEGPWADTPWALPVDNKLAEELVAPEKIYSSDGFRFRITPKDSRAAKKKGETTLRDTLGRSPDRGDSVAYLYCAVRQIEAYRQYDTSNIVLAYGSPAEYLPEDIEKAKKERENMHPEARNLLDFLESRGSGFGYDLLDDAAERP